MNSVFRRRWAFIALPALALALAGCSGVAVGGYGYTTVYGDYGYVGPWGGGPVDVTGGYFVAPPYGRGNRGRPAARPGASAHRAPAGNSSRQIPSIPNRSRPSAPKGGGSRGGGGGGSHGGGGGTRKH